MAVKQPGLNFAVLNNTSDACLVLVWTLDGRESILELIQPNCYMENSISTRFGAVHHVQVETLSGIVYPIFR